MPTKFAKILGENKDLINGLFGSIDNVKVKENYNEVLSSLTDEEKRHNDSRRYSKLTQTLNTAKLGDEDLYTTSKKIDYSKPDFSDPGTIVGDRYSKYMESLRGNIQQGQKPSGQGMSSKQVPFMDAMNNTTPATFEDFIKNDPVAQAELQKYMQEIKTENDPEAIKTSRYKKAGLSDEDIAFYDEYQPTDAQGHNEGLADILNKNAQALQSTGSYGSDFAKLLADKLQGLQIPETVIPQPKYNTKYDEKTGKLIYYSDDPSGETFTKQVTAPEVKTPEFKGAKIMQDAEGKYIWYNKVWDAEKGDFVDKKVGDANEQEIADFELDQLKKSVSEEKLLNPKSPGRRRKSGKSGKSGKGGPMTQGGIVLSKKLKDFAKLKTSVKGTIEESSLTGKDKTKFRILQKDLLNTYFDGDTTKLDKYTNKLLKATNKQIPGIISEIIGEQDEDAEDNGLTEQENLDLIEENALLEYKKFMLEAESEEAKQEATNEFLKSIGAKN